ncbi:MAG: hypothetical protein E6Q59_04385 [Nitrosomonas sp.]|nr:hypothetical protein [Nitrosomonas sp.]OQW85461.1 MAG: hypothetical protein BVN30_00690 [Proteobacteria bacterium ST_bin16]TXI39770.1 MAG: hypothetical protein E6Q59_04385 [Nitrosomonas sp.]
MKLDIEKYRKHLAPYNLGKEREEEIIRYVYMIMDEFVSAAFNKHPVQHALQERNCEALQSQGGMIDSKDHSIKSPPLKATSHAGE